MSTWQSKDMGDGIDAFAPSQQLFQAFETLELSKVGALPAGIGVFSLYDLRRNVVTWFFSPEAEVLAQAFGASPCTKPTPVEGFGLLVGSALSWTEHFPGFVKQSRGAAT